MNSKIVCVFLISTIEWINSMPVCIRMCVCMYMLRTCALYRKCWLCCKLIPIYITNVRLWFSVRVSMLDIIESANQRTPKQFVMVDDRLYYENFSVFLLFFFFVPLTTAEKSTFNFTNAICWRNVDKQCLSLARVV